MAAVTAIAPWLRGTLVASPPAHGLVVFILELVKALVSRALHAHDVSLYSHGLLGVRSQRCASYLDSDGSRLGGRAASSCWWRWWRRSVVFRSSVDGCSSPVAAGANCVAHEVMLPWMEPSSLGSARRLPFTWTDSRKLMASVAIVVPFAERQLDDDVLLPWVRHHVRLAARALRHGGSGVPQHDALLAFYINTRFTAEHVRRIEAAMLAAAAAAADDADDHGECTDIAASRGGRAANATLGRARRVSPEAQAAEARGVGLAWPFAPTVHYLEARLHRDPASDRYARDSWLSERDSPGTGNMFYPLVLNNGRADGGAHFARRLVASAAATPPPWSPAGGAVITTTAAFADDPLASRRIAARYMFYCEPDNWAVRASFVPALVRLANVAETRRAFIVGSPLRSGNRGAATAWRLQYHAAAYRTHINGNALYRLGDDEFAALLRRVREQYAPAAFDLAIDRYLHARNDAQQHRREAADVLPRIIRTHFVQNYGGEPYSIERVRAESPSTYFVHGKHRRP